MMDPLEHIVPLPHQPKKAARRTSPEAGAETETGLQDVHSGSTHRAGEGGGKDGAEEEAELQSRTAKLAAHLGELWGICGPSESSLLGWNSWALPLTTWSVTGCGRLGRGGPLRR